MHKIAVKYQAHVRFGSKADMCAAKRHVCFTPNSDRESEIPQKAMSALPPKADNRLSASGRFKGSFRRACETHRVRTGIVSTSLIRIPPRPTRNDRGSGQ